MEMLLHDWGGLLVRWLHLAAGIAWIGTSFYFIWLDYSLRQNAHLPAGVLGESWSVHGGGFYHVQKYTVAPEKMPAELHWFKYEAYVTWLSGFAMLAVVYHWSASTYLIDPAKADLSPLAAVGLSVASLVAGWVVYSFICKSPLGRHTGVLLAGVYVLVVAMAWGLSQIFTDRAALIHTGAVIGTVMAANVAMIIIPNQKKTVAALLAGEPPEPALGQIAKQRSLHNNYLTLPVLLLMVSSHYPMLSAGGQVWLSVAFIVLIGGVVRHFFNTQHAGGKGRALMWQWPTAAGLVLVLAWSLQAASSRPTAEGEEIIGTGEALAIVQTRCALCHAPSPTDENFDQPPAGIVLQTAADLRRLAPRIQAQAILSEAMPLGNKTRMTPVERAQLGAWIRAGMPE
jgi:uncharacterized membrane protein